MNEQRVILTEKNARIIIGIGTIGIIVIAVFGFITVFSTPVHAPGISQTKSAITSKTYTSTLGYTFEYPEAYHIQEYSPAYVSIGTSTDSSSSIAEADVLTSEAGDISPNFSEFAHEQAKLTCAADGPSSSIDCPRVSRTGSFTTASGLAGEVFYLAEDTHSLTAGSVVETERGPYYAFSLSGGAAASNDASAPYTLLLVRPPSATEPDMIEDTTITAIARSVRITTTP